MYSADTVAKYLIMRCYTKGTPINNLKLQKILYFVQAEFLVVKNQPCFPESIEACDFGPVVPNIYHRYKIYGSANIPFVSSKEEFPFSKEDERLIDGIINECAKYSTTKLMTITLNQDPWKNTYQPCCRNAISNESIRKFFKET